MSIRMVALDEEVIGSFIKLISQLTDPSSNSGKRYSQEEVLTCLAIGMLQGENDFCNIEKVLNFNKEELTALLGINSIPSDDTMMRRLKEIDSEELSHLLKEQAGECKDDYIVLDGKGLRACAEVENGSITPYILNARARFSGKCCGGIYVSEKENEKSKAPELIKSLDYKNVTYGGDANMTTQEIRKAIVSQGNNFVLALKDNNKCMCRAAETLFDEVEACEDAEHLKQHFLPPSTRIHKFYDPEDYDIKTIIEKGHGREEFRQYSLLKLNEEVSTLFGEGIAAIGKAVRKRRSLVAKRRPKKKKAKKQARRNNRAKKPRKKQKTYPVSSRCNEVETTETVYYILSNPEEDIDRFADFCRDEWDIENKAHYIYDEVFREDRSRLKDEKIRLNMGLFRRLIYNILLSLDLVNDDGEKLKETPRAKRSYLARNLVSVLKLLLGPFDPCMINQILERLLEASYIRISKSLGASRRL